MQINRLRLVNFRQHERTELEFGAGLTGIIGPNGAGKTTLLEAIAWAMYGMPAARGSRDSIKRRGAPPRSRVEVELDFTLGPHQYRVVRTLTNAELYQDGDAAPIANSIGTVTEKVARLLGMAREEFFNTYFTGQKELAVMAAMSAPERAQFLSRVLGYERIRTAQDRLKERRSALRARLDGIRSSLPDPAALDADAARAQERLAAAAAAEQAALAALEAADRTLAEVQPRWQAMQQLRDTAAALDAELRVLEAQVQSAGEQLEALEHEAKAAAAAAGRLGQLRERLAALPALRRERQELDARAKAVAARSAAVAQLEAVRQRLADGTARLARLPAPELVEQARARERDLRAQHAAAALQAGERRTAWVRDAQDAATKRDTLIGQYRELKAQRQAIMEAGQDGACPTCARPLGGEFDAVLGMLDRQLEEVLFNGNFYKRRIEQLKEEPADLDELDRRVLALEREISDVVGQVSLLEAQAREAPVLRDEVGRLTERVRELERAAGEAAAEYDQARHDEVQHLIGELEPLELEAAGLAVAAERGETLAASAAALRERRTTACAKVDEVRGRLSGLDYSEEAFQETRAAEQSAERARRDAELALVRARSEEQAAREAGKAVEQRRAERAAREREAAQVAADLLVHQELDRALADLRTDLNATLRPDLSEIASGFVRDLTNGRYTDLELDESYVPTLLDDGDPKAVISGGEEDVANLALRLAISQMIAERAGQPLSLLVLDEIFGSLDEDRRAAVVELLRSLADRFPQVILITHVDSVRDGFDRVIRVGFDIGRGVAVVREEPMEGRDVAA